jgi:hypothetical protein
MNWLEGILNEVQDIGSQDMGPEPAPCVVYPCPSEPEKPMKAVQVPCDVKNCVKSKLSEHPSFCSMLDKLVDYIESLNIYKELLAESQARLAELNSIIDAIKVVLEELGCNEFYQGNDGPGTDPQFDEEAEVHPVCAAYYKQLYRLEALRKHTKGQIEGLLEFISATEGIINAFQQSYTNIINSAAEECRNEQEGSTHIAKQEKEALDKETV